MSKFLINKLIIPRGEQSGLIPEEAFGICKYHRAVEVILQTSFLGQVNTTEHSRWHMFYGRSSIIWHIVSLSGFHCGSILGDNTPNNMTAPLYLTSNYIFPRTDVWDLDIIYGYKSYNPSQGLCQGNVVGTVLWICVSTYTIKFLRQRVHSILLFGAISAENKRLDAFLFWYDTDLPVKGNSLYEFHKKL